MKKALQLRIREARDDSIQISGLTVFAHAKNLTEQFGHEDFDPGMNNTGRSLHRRGLVFRSIVGEEKAVSKEAVGSWKSSVLPDLHLDYSPHDICNAD